MRAVGKLCARERLPLLCSLSHPRTPKRRRCSQRACTAKEWLSQTLPNAAMQPAMARRQRISIMQKAPRDLGSQQRPPKKQGPT